MKAPSSGAKTGAVALALVLAFLSAAPAQIHHEDRNRVIPDAAFKALMKEANKFIAASLEGIDKSSPDVATLSVKSNALLIALAAQNRMGKPGAEGRKMATLRDTALRLADAVEKDTRDYAAAARLAQALDDFANLKPDPNAQLIRFRLKDRCDHDDVVFLFGGCGGRREHRIEFELHRHGRLQKPFTDAEREKVELLACKVALIGEVLRDMDDFFTVRTVDRRKEWVSHAVEMQSRAWELAALARSRDNAATKMTLNALRETCNNCHHKFRD